MDSRGFGRLPMGTEEKRSARKEGLSSLSKEEKNGGNEPTFLLPVLSQKRISRSLVDLISIALYSSDDVERGG